MLWFGSDGCFYVTKRKCSLKGTLSFSSVNEWGSLSFLNLLRRMGFDFNFRVSRRKSGVVEFKVRSSRLSLVKKFCSEVGFSVDYKQSRLLEFVKLRNL